jgi:hypothetical protein
MVPQATKRARIVSGIIYHMAERKERAIILKLLIFLMQLSPSISDTNWINFVGASVSLQQPRCQSNEEASWTTKGCYLRVDCISPLYLYNEAWDGTKRSVSTGSFAAKEPFFVIAEEYVLLQERMHVQIFFFLL